MALLGSAVSGEVGLRLLLSPIASNVVLRTACCAVGIGLPVYSTFKAIEKKDQNEQEKWLLYWAATYNPAYLIAAYGSFSLVEVFSDKILSWFPVYYHMKFAFLVWLQLPSNNGSKHLYARHLRPFLLKHQARIDGLLSFLATEINKFVSSHQGEIRFLKTVAVKCANTANQIVKDITEPVQPRGHNMIEDSSSLARGQTADSDSES